MQIVIDISENKYKLIQEGEYCGLLDKDLYQSIKNGKPLPENPTNGDMAQAVFDDRGYKAIKERMEHTMWWKAPYEKERKE